MAYPEPRDRVLSEDEKEQIREDILDGNPSSGHLADKYNCSPSQVAGIKAHLSRNHDLGKVKIIKEDEVLDSIIEKYRKFYNSSRHSNEEYKWDHVRRFQDQWPEVRDKYGEEFFERLKSAIENGENLIGWRSLARMEDVFKERPDEATGAVKYLLEGDAEIYDRIDNFFEVFYRGHKESSDRRAASFFLASLYPDRFVHYKYTEFKNFYDDFSIELENGFTSDDRVGHYLEVNEKAKEILEEISLEDKELWHVQDLIYYYSIYWMPENVEKSLEKVFSRGRQAYTRLYALKCFFDIQENGEVSKKELEDYIGESAKDEEVPGENPHVYKQVGPNVFDNYEPFVRREDSYEVKEDYKQYIKPMSFYIDYLWDKAVCDTSYFVVSHNENPDELEDEYLRASYTEDSDSFEDTYLPQRDLSRLSVGDIILHYRSKEFVGYSKVTEEPVVREKDEEGKEFYLEVDIDWFDNPRGLSSVRDVLEEEKSRVDKHYVLTSDGRKAEGYLKVLTERGARYIINFEEDNSAVGKYVEEYDFSVQLPDSLFFKKDKELESQIEASINSGKNIIFTGPPGTGKTKLAKHISEEFSESNSYPVDGAVFTTATADWTAFDTIGGYMPSNGETEKLVFNPGQFLKCFREENGDASKVTNKWLVIDEINRSDIDKAFGQLFSVLSGDSVELPYTKEVDGRKQNVEIRNVEDNGDELKKVKDRDNIYPVTSSWRLIATMNTMDKTSLYEMSYAFMRRFNFIHVGVPSLKDGEKVKTDYLKPGNGYANVWEEKHSEAVEVLEEDEFYKDLSVLWYKVNRTRPIGPSIILDILKYLEARGYKDAEEEKRKAALTDAVTSLVFPQMEGLTKDDLKQFLTDLYKDEAVGDEEDLKVGLIDEKELKRRAENFFKRDLNVEN